MSTYWKDRMAASLARISKKSTRAIEKQLKEYYQKTMANTIADFEATYDKLLAASAEGREPTPADLYKLDRYWKMQAQLQKELTKLGDKQAALLRKEFEANFFEVYYSIAKDSTAAYSQIDSSIVQQMINQVWVADGKSWSQRIWDNTNHLAATLNEQLISCVVAGKKTGELKNLLIERFNVSYSQADSLVRTELAHIQTQATQKRYKDIGLQEVEIWADEDERRCEVCGKLHMKRYPVNAQVPIPAHPRCRCCIIPVVEND